MRDYLIKLHHSVLLFNIVEPCKLFDVCQVFQNANSSAPHLKFTKLVCLVHDICLAVIGRVDVDVITEHPKTIL